MFAWVYSGHFTWRAKTAGCRFPESFNQKHKKQHASRKTIAAVWIPRKKFAWPSSCPSSCVPTRDCLAPIASCGVLLSSTKSSCLITQLLCLTNFLLIVLINYVQLSRNCCKSLLLPHRQKTFLQTVHPQWDRSSLVLFGFLTYVNKSTKLKRNSRLIWAEL